MEKILAGIETRLIHAGKPEPPIEGAVVTPIFQSSTFEYLGQRSYHDLHYIRLSNTPNHTGLHRKLAAMPAANKERLAQAVEKLKAAHQAFHDDAQACIGF